MVIVTAEPSKPTLDNVFSSDARYILFQDMNTFTELPIEEFFSLMERYQADHPATLQIEALDSEIEQRVYEQLSEKWENGLDFCTTCGFFGDRGTSVLIQNTQVDWQKIWDWLLMEYPSLPDGAMINFEVWDSIREGNHIGGEMLLRRVILANGIYAQATNAG